MSDMTTGYNKVQFGDKVIVGSLGSKGGTQIPKEVREFLNLKPNDRIVYHLRKDKVEIERGIMSLEEAFGSVTPLQPEKTLEEVIQEAKEDHYTARYKHTVRS